MTHDQAEVTGGWFNRKIFFTNWNHFESIDMSNIHLVTHMHKQNLLAVHLFALIG